MVDKALPGELVNFFVALEVIVSLAHNFERGGEACAERRRCELVALHTSVTRLARSPRFDRDFGIDPLMLS